MKFLSFVLVLLLALFLLPGIAVADDLYDQYGAMADWGDKEWSDSDEWSEEQWDEYYQGSAAAREQEESARIREELQKMGVPDPEGVNVKLDERYLLFDGAAPRMISRSVYLPLRAFFSAAGLKASFSYDPESRGVTVTCEDGSTLLLAADDDVIIITRPDEEPQETSTWNEPQLIEGSMYVAESDICSFLGWESYVNYQYEILYIVDPQPLIEAIDRDFTIVNRWISNGMELDMEQSYKFAGRLGFSGALYGEEKPDAISAYFSYEGLRKGLDIDISFSIQLDIKQMQNSVFSVLDAETWLILNAVGAGKGRLITNSEEEMLYLQSNLLPFIDKRLKATDWLKLDYPIQEISELIATLTAPEQRQLLSPGQLIYQSKTGYYYGENNPYSDVLEKAKLWQSLLGDKNLAKTHSGGYDVYSVDANKIAIPGLGLTGSGLLGLFGYYGHGDEDEAADASYALRFREKAGRLEDVEIKASIQTLGPLPMTCTLDYSSSSLKQHCSLELKGRYIGKLLFSAEHEAQPTTELPSQAPPPGSHPVEWPEYDSFFRLLFR